MRGLFLAGLTACTKVLKARTARALLIATPRPGRIVAGQGDVDMGRESRAREQKSFAEWLFISSAARAEGDWPVEGSLFLCIVGKDFTDARERERVSEEHGRDAGIVSTVAFIHRQKMKREVQETVPLHCRMQVFV